MTAERIEWVEIVEPRTREHMYANLTTGECVWEPPPGVPVKRTDDNQWWELFDSNTGRFYYYNASSQKTVWHRPHNCDIIPLAKLQTLKQNTEAPINALKSSYYDVPRSPSVGSNKSSELSSTPTYTQKSLRSNKTVNCQTQTDENESPKQRRKHQHGAKCRSGNLHKQNSSSSCQTALSSTSSRESSRQRGTCLKHTPLKHSVGTQPEPRSRSDSRNDIDNDSLQDAVLQQQTEEIAAEVQKFFEQNEERLLNQQSKFPLDSPSPKDNGNRPGSSSSAGGHFVRSFATGTGSPLLTRHSLRTGPEGSSATLGSRPSRQRSFDLPATNAHFRGAYAQNLTAEAKIVSTRRRQPLKTASERSDSPGSTSVESTPHLPRRQPLELAPQPDPEPPAIRPKKTLLGVASPRPWQSKPEPNGDVQLKEEGSPVWTHRSELAMIKSLDSGIKSSESTAERPHEETVRTAEIKQTEPVAVSSPVPKVRQSLRKVSQDSGPMSLARPYPQIAAHLQFSQEHQQFIIDPDYQGVYDGSEPTSQTVMSSEDELELDEDEVFADDEVDLDHTPSFSSCEDLPDSRRSNRNSSSPIYADVPDPTSGVKPPPVRNTSSPYGHFHPSRASARTPGRTNDWQPKGKKAPAPLPPQLKLANLKRRSDADTSANEIFGARGSLERTPMVYPGDISPPCHRPQSMCVGPSPLDQLPPNTATLSRPMKRDNRDPVSVSRSSSSLTRGVAPPSLSLYQGDPGMESYVKENINRPRKGLFGKKQSPETILSWTRESIKKPLIMTSDKVVKKEACNVFKRIQAYMGDRKVKASVSMDQIALDLCIRGWAKQPLRDEIYVQLCKQTTDNNRPDSLRRGWELFAICLSFFPPSSNMHSYLDSYLTRNADPVLDTEVRVSHYALHCCKKLERAINAHNLPPAHKKTLKKPSLDEIEGARIQIFHPSMFGNCLDEVMLIQREKFQSRQLPWIQTVLSEMVLQLGGARTEGIFRVPGDIDEVNALKMRMDRWLVPVVSDPHVPASLLKLWYRELADPLIPQSCYEQCLAVADQPTEALRVVDRLPRINKLVLAYLVRFLQVFIRPENVAETKMDSSNLAMVMAPNCLRCQSEDPRVIFENTRREMAFIKTLMENYDTSFMEGIL